MRRFDARTSGSVTRDGPEGGGLAQCHQPQDCRGQRGTDSATEERRRENVEILVIYIDGQRFGKHHILNAVGVDVEGSKHILGVEPGAT